MINVRYINKAALLIATIAAWTAHASDGEAPSVLPEMIAVEAGTFTMGNPDAYKGESDERPRHAVTLSAYRIGKYEVTNALYSAVINWAYDQRLVKTSGGPPFVGRGTGIYFNGRLLKRIAGDSRIVFSSERFRVLMQDGMFMENHPVEQITWFGAVAFCNWLSEIEGLEPCYNLETWTCVNPSSGGYRLPTEAEWERAAGWTGDDDTPTWKYAFDSGDLTAARGNFGFKNPLSKLGLETYPYTSPVGYFDGEKSTTEDSPSPVGCYDMSGNVYEWCEDWFAPYTDAPQTDPVGPAEGGLKVVRGGGWSSIDKACRVHNRGWSEPGMGFRTFGFRLAQSVR